MDQRLEKSDVLKRYGLALLLAGLALLIRGVLPVMEGTPIYQLPLAAVIVSAGIGGRGPGYVAAAACWVGIVYWLLPPTFGFAIDRQDIVGLSIFTALCVLFVEFSARRWLDLERLRRVEESLRQSQSYLAEAQRMSQTGSWALDVASKKYLYTSEESDRIWGFARGEKPSRQAVSERIHPDDRSQWKMNLEKSLLQKEDTSDEYRIVLPDGTVRHLRTIRHPVLDADGQVVKVVGTSVDITERKRTEEALRASEARFRTFVDHARDAFFLMDENSVVVDVNRQACESLGRTREELIGMHPRKFDTGLDERAIAHLAERVAAGETLTFETRHRHRDGTTFPVEIRSHMFRQGERRFFLALARDITERKLAEETVRGKDKALQMARTELARVSRLTTLGELTASIAHEVNQPLGAMVANAGAGARWLAAEPPAVAKARQALQSIASDGKRAGEVIARIRSLTKRGQSPIGRMDVNHKVEGALALVDHELRSNGIVVETRLDGALPAVEGDGVQLQQVLLNLVMNAIDAMTAVNDRPRELTIVSARQDESAVRIDVRDSGVGLDAGSAERVFEAFYTTKPEGLGIGLAISRSIIEAHGGRLWAEPNAPHGAVFRFSLPAARENAA